jgi:predicted dithiol-disulfide oxidoreductase (DUF899 family)
MGMKKNTVVSDREWTRARIELLKEEKELMQASDRLSERRRLLPARRVQKQYEFVGPNGTLQLGDLFGTKSQLVVYHFMFAQGWDAGCPSCSIITDSLAPLAPHLAARDVQLTLVSRAGIDTLLGFRERMGWKLPWVSSARTDFNQDFQACTDDVTPDGRYYYNYELMSRYPIGEQPGLSVFRRDNEGNVYHTYSTYARGLENFVGAYSILNVVPKGRDEDELPWGMGWVRLHDSYEETEESGECPAC